MNYATLEVVLQWCAAGTCGALSFAIATTCIMISYALVARPEWARGDADG